MSRRGKAHQQRERCRSRRALDRAILRCVRQLTWHDPNGAPRICLADTIELIGLKLARDKAS
jgi:hypothetical protein